MFIILTIILITLWTIFLLTIWNIFFFHHVDYYHVYCLKFHFVYHVDQLFGCVLSCIVAIWLRWQIEARGGQCIPVQCDHAKDSDIEKLFEKVKQEQDGRLDVLVNNAYSGVQVMRPYQDFDYSGALVTLLDVTSLNPVPDNVILRPISGIRSHWK